MVSHLSGVYLLSFCLTGLYDGSMPNLCSITSIGILGISDICHAKTLRLSQRKVTSVSSYLALRPMLIRTFLSGFLESTGTSLSSTPFSYRPPADRWAADSMVRQHICISLLKEVKGSWRSMAWALMISVGCCRPVSLPHWLLVLVLPFHQSALHGLMLHSHMPEHPAGQT
jgi:hypothetical protein